MKLNIFTSFLFRNKITSFIITKNVLYSFTLYDISHNINKKIYFLYEFNPKLCMWFCGLSIILYTRKAPFNYNTCRNRFQV